MNTSNTNAHTPGPWHVSGCRANDDNLICHGDENETSPIIAQVLSDGGALPRLANARLISGAPELLAALAEAVDELEQMHRHYYGNCPGGCPACVAIDKARAAIAKATAE